MATCSAVQSMRLVSSTVRDAGDRLDQPGGHAPGDDPRAAARQRYRNQIAAATFPHGIGSDNESTLPRTVPIASAGSCCESGFPSSGLAVYSVPWRSAAGLAAPC